MADFYGDRFIQFGKALDYTNEGFGLPFNTNFEPVFSRFATRANLSVGETYFMGSSDKNGPFMVVTEIRI